MSQKQETHSAQPMTSSRRTLLVGGLAAGFSALMATNAAAASAADTPVKMVACLRKRPDLTLPEFYDYWLHQHAPLATKLVQQLGANRYVQSHTSDRDLGLLLETSRGQVLKSFDGVTEVWFPSRQALMAKMSTVAGTEANARLALDEKNFIDLPSSSYFMSREYRIFG